MFGSKIPAAQGNQSHRQNHHRISAYLAELDRIASLLATAGVAVILIENGVLARAVYSCPGCFDFGDLDLLVRPEQFPVIHRVLTDEGYKLQSTFGNSNSGTPNLADGRAEYAIMLAEKHLLRLNFQWSLVARRWFSPDREPDLDTLFARSVPISGSAARMLCPEDNLFQLAVHNASHGYIRKPGRRLHLDIERFVRRVPINWEDFLKLVEHFQVETRVYFSLVIPKILFETPVPDVVLNRLKPPTWKECLLNRWLQPAGLFNPDKKRFSRPGYILFTILLYDDLAGLWRAIFPDQAWMRERYTMRHNWLLPFYHMRRLIDLTFRRTI